MKTTDRTFLLMTCAVFGSILLPTLFMDGMFTDGVLYAAVSRNLAHNIGTFWDPSMSKSMHAHFHEQPPLMFFLQSILFRIFGDGFYTERIYSALMALINGFLLFRIGKIILPGKEHRWLPVFFWLAIPQTIYAFTNNVEECTMSVFVLAAALHFIRAMRENKKETLHFLLAGAFLTCAGLTKGLQGLFLLGAPFLWWLCVRDTSFRKMVFDSLRIVFVPAVFTCFIFLYEPARNSFAAYFDARFTATFAHAHDTTTSHFYILGQLLLNLSPAILAAFLLYFAGRKSGPVKQKRLILFFLCCGLAGTLPLMVTLEQRAFYMTTSLPFFALAFALFAWNGVDRICTFLSRRRKLNFSLSAFFIAGLVALLICITSIITSHGIKRDADVINDLNNIAKQTGNETTIRTNTVLCSDWGLQNYAIRYHGITLDPSDTSVAEWMLVEKTDSSVPEGFQSVNVAPQLKRFRLLKAVR